MARLLNKTILFIALASLSLGSTAQTYGLVCTKKEKKEWIVQFNQKIQIELTKVNGKTKTKRARVTSISASSFAVTPRSKKFSTEVFQNDQSLDFIKVRTRFRFIVGPVITLLTAIQYVGSFVELRAPVTSIAFFPSYRGINLSKDKWKYEIRELSPEEVNPKRITAQIKKVE